MAIWHLTLSAEGRMPLFPTPVETHAAVRAVASAAGSWLSLFCVVDEHVHVVVTCDRARAGRVARSLLIALRRRSRASLRPAHLTAVESRSHAGWLARRYLVAQPERHALPVHPALYAGSCFQDLAGARHVPGLGLRLTEMLPRFQLHDAIGAVGLPPAPIEPLGWAQVRLAGAGRLAAAASHACAVGPDLAGNTAPVVAARRAVAHLAAQAGIGRREVAFALGVGESGVRSALRSPADDALVRAVRVRLALEESVSRAPPLAREPEPPRYGSD